MPTPPRRSELEENCYDPTGQPMSLWLHTNHPGLLMAMTLNRGLDDFELERFIDLLTRHPVKSEAESVKALWCAIAQHPGLSLEQIDKIVSWAPIVAVHCLAYREFLPANVAARLAADTDFQGRCAATVCRHLPAECVADLAHDENPNVRCMMAMMGSLPEALVASLAADPVPQVRHALATNLNLAPAQREQLARSEDPLIRQSVASRLDLPGALVGQLAEDSDPSVRSVVAARPGLPRDLRRRLAEDADDKVRASAQKSAAANLPFGLRLPLGRADAMALDASVQRRMWAAFNLSLSREMWRHLAADEDGNVRAALAFNAGADPRGLGRLAADPQPFIRLIALGHPLLPEEALLAATAPPGCDETVAHVLLGRAKLPTIILRRLAQHPDDHVRHAISAMPEALPKDVFDRLARDPCVWVRRSLAWRRDFPADWYDALTGDDDVDVLEDLASRGHPCRRQDEARQRLDVLIGSRSTVQTRREIATRPHLTNNLIARLVKDAAPEVRAVIAAHPELGANRVLHLARDPAACVRLAVASRARLTPKVRELLAADADPEVKQLAARPAKSKVAAHSAAA